MTNNNWVMVGDLASLKTAKRQTFKHAGQQIHLIMTDAGDVFAIDNRCPHEGFPLSEGSVGKNCQLTCNWHGWTFDLESGDPTVGRDPLRKYPVEIRDGKVWVDVSPLDQEKQATKARADMIAALDAVDAGYLARAVTRYHLVTAQIDELLTDAILWTEGKFERGFGHAFAGLLDRIKDYDDLSGQGPDQLVPIIDGLLQIGWDVKFDTVKPFASSEAVAQFDAKELAAAVEASDEERALTHIAAAEQAGIKPDFLFDVMRPIPLSHYMGFGHAAIYLMVAEGLTQRLGNKVGYSLACQLVRYWCTASREDLIPEFRIYHDYLNGEHEAGELHEVAELIGQSVRNILPLVAPALQQPEQLWESLLAASAQMLLRFDADIEHNHRRSVSNSVNWLDFTHMITFAEAVRHHANKDKRLWKAGLLQMALFVGRNGSYILPSDQTEELFSQWQVADVAQFWRDQQNTRLNSTGELPIYAVHRLKMAASVQRMWPSLSPNTQSWLGAGLNRYLNAHMRQRYHRELAHQAHQLVSKQV